MPHRLVQRVAVVTNAGSRGPGLGNGKAVAILVAREGARVLCVDAKLENAEETAKLISQEGDEARWVTGQTLVVDGGLTITTR